MAALITRDLLGSGHMESQELDLDLQVPNGWEKRLDLKSGKVYLERCAAQPSAKLQDLNYPPSSYQSSHNHYQFVDDSNFLALKLTSPSSPSGYQSVCTLDKVKSALERAQREPRTIRSPYRKSPPSSSSSSSEGEMVMVGTPVAAGCPSCLLYVLISKNNPRCPRCNSVVPLPGSRKPSLDLNISM